MNGDRDDDNGIHWFYYLHLFGIIISGGSKMKGPEERWEDQMIWNQEPFREEDLDKDMGEYDGD